MIFSGLHISQHKPAAALAALVGLDVGYRLNDIPIFQLHTPEQGRLFLTLALPIYLVLVPSLSFHDITIQHTGECLTATQRSDWPVTAACAPWPPTSR